MTKRLLSFILAVFFLRLIGVSHCQEPAFKEKENCFQSGFGLSCDIELLKTKVKRGGKISFWIKTRNLGKPIFVFNPRFCGLLQVSGNSGYKENSRRFFPGGKAGRTGVPYPYFRWPTKG
jgi:hypothetical protein